MHSADDFLLAAILAYICFAVFDKHHRHWWWGKRWVLLRTWQRILLGPDLLYRPDGFGWSPIRFRIGDRVRHKREGWIGVVSEIDPETTQASESRESCAIESP